jgi:signal transduction histidine kinase
MTVIDQLVNGASTPRVGRARGRSAQVGVAIAVCCAVLSLLLPIGAALWATTTGLASPFALVVFAASAGTLGGLLMATRPRNPVSWAFALSGLAFAVGLFAEQYAAHGQDRPGSLPGAWVALWLQSWVYQPALVLMFVIMPLYFPDGRLPSPRWRWMPPVALAVLVLGSMLQAVAPGEVRLGESKLANPLAIDALRPIAWVPAVLGLSLLGLGIAAVTSLVMRFRRARQEQRQQVKWVVYALVLTAVAFGVDAVVALAVPASYSVVFPVIQVVPVTIVVAAGVAILRHQLFDIDLLINRTLVYGALTICLIVGYVVVVGWLGAVQPARDDPVLALLATGLVAVAFAPLRDRLQRLVDRLLYGHRNDPYRALTLLGQRLEATLAPEAVLPTVAVTVSDALKLPYTAVEVGRAGRFTTTAEHGRRPPNDKGLRNVPLTYRGEQVGRLTLTGRGRRQELSGADRRILDDLAVQIGTALHAVMLTADLQHSREQLVVAREEERRRVGRDLHDGLGPQLASLSMKAETARDLIPTNPDRAVELLSELLDHTERAVREVRRVAHQLRPPVLDSLGLVPALRLHAGEQRQLRVHVDVPDELPELAAAVEVAAYHITLESLHNIVSHAGADRCTIRIRHDLGALRVEISDNGRGIPPDHRVGVGLSSMRERAAELGGSCTVERAPSGGTLIRSVLPTSTATSSAPGSGA